MRPSRALAVVSLSALAIAGACVTDHGALEKKPSSGAGGSSGGKGGSGGFGPLGGSSGSSSGGTAGRRDEPPGQNELTLLHGVVDSEELVFCFAKYDPESNRSTFEGAPFPEQGLSFGRRASTLTLSGVDLENDAIHAFVIGGDLSLIEGLDCEDAVALAEQAEREPSAAAGLGGAPGEGGAGGEGGQGAAGAGGEGGGGGAPPEPPPIPPKLRVRSLALLPEGTLAGGRSYLFVAAGCLGGPAFTDPIDEEICGPNYDAATPTVTPIVVTLSRQTVFGEVGIQVVHASLATPRFDLQATPPPKSGDFPIVLASNVTLGAVVPRPPRFGFSHIELGANTPNWSVDITMSGAKKSEFWPTILARGGLSELSISKSYALVVVGPRADIEGFSWWNQAVVTAVPTDPLE